MLTASASFAKPHDMPMSTRPTASFRGQTPVPNHVRFRSLPAQASPDLTYIGSKIDAEDVYPDGVSAPPSLLQPSPFHLVTDSKRLWLINMWKAWKVGQESGTRRFVRYPMCTELLQHFSCLNIRVPLAKQRWSGLLFHHAW